jgi:predicted  nucleic acid-binding Zn-ribbon protein
MNYQQEIEELNLIIETLKGEVQELKSKLLETEELLYNYKQTFMKYPDDSEGESESGAYYFSE